MEHHPGIRERLPITDLHTHTLYTFGHLMTYSELIDKYYPAGTTRRVIYLRHCRSVAELALEIAGRLALPLEREDVEAAAMLHDIGICLTDAPDIDCHGSEPYLCHGILGGRLIREAGLPEKWSRVAERHTGAGITNAEINEQHLPLPFGEYMPETQLERLICYADKFYSKSGNMELKPFEKVLASMKRISDATAERFMELHSEFSAGFNP